MAAASVGSSGRLRNGTSSTPYIYYVDNYYPEESPGFWVQRVENLKGLGKDRYNGYEIKMVPGEFHDQAKYTAYCPDSSDIVAIQSEEFTTLLGNDGDSIYRLVMVKGPASSYTLLNHPKVFDEGYDDNYAADIASTQAHQDMRNRIHKAGNEYRLWHHYLFVFPEGVILDNRILSTHPKDLFRVGSTFASAPSDSETAPGCGLCWRIAESGVTQQLEETKKEDTGSSAYKRAMEKHEAKKKANTGRRGN